MAVGVEHDSVLVCVAILGRANGPFEKPVAEVTRVASDGSTKHSASKALAAITRTALNLGWTRIVSYTLLGEAGTIYRACGWRPTAISEGGEHSRAARPRSASVQPGPKVRWEAGPEAMPMDKGVDRLVLESIGQVPIAQRVSRLPLFDGMVLR